MTKRKINLPARTGKPPLALLDAAAKALGQCVRADAAKNIRDIAVAFQAYAKQAKDTVLVKRATEVRFRAETKAGELLLTMEKNKGAVAGKTGIKTRPVLDPTPTLESLGINKAQSKRWQDLAKRKDTCADLWQQQLDRACTIAAAVIDGDGAVLAALNEERHRNAQMRRDVNEQLLASQIRALPDKKYGVIYADVAWKFETWSDKGLTSRSAANHYVTSDLAEIRNLDVDRIAADDCVLFLWSTVPMLPEALEVMGAWGFIYVSHFCWVKNRVGTGYWARNRHELLLIGVRGKIPAPAPGTQFDSVIEAAVGRHSEKPEIFAEMIEAYFPNIPKIELYRRGPARPNWSAWGAEAITKSEGPDPEIEALPPINGGKRPAVSG